MEEKQPNVTVTIDDTQSAIFFTHHVYISDCIVIMIPIFGKNQLA